MSKSKKVPKASRTPKYCWDTTVFLAWIKEEASAPLEDIELVVDEIDRNAAVLVVSGIVQAEILEAELKPAQRAMLGQVLSRSNVVNADATVPIFQKAGEIRSRGHAEKPKRKIKTADATVIATAISYGVDALHTLDDKLLRLSGKPIIDGLKICKPMPLSGQRGLEGLR